jgi:hypothetical protein
MHDGPADCPWQRLEDHFRDQAHVVNHFRDADAASVVAMWESRGNAEGEPLSRFERDALIERHCELFGTWPE